MKSWAKVLNILKLQHLQFKNRILRSHKICTKCGKLLPFGSFNSDKSKKDGKYSSCISCCVVAWSSRKHATKISKAIYDAEYRGKNKELLTVKKEGVL